MRLNLPISLTAALAVVLLSTVVSRGSTPTAGGGSAPASTPPAQPTSGPGGSQYSCSLVEEHTYGEGDLQYWLFEPADPKPESAPVVVFNHGWSAMTPGGYRAWINHIVRRGNIVIYPRYQASLRTMPATMSTNAIAATKDALQRLATESGHVRPQLDKLAVVGHSAGGQISAGMGARAASSGLPPFKAVMCVQPGKTWGPQITQIPLDDVSTMPASTLLLTVVGDRDTIAKDIDAKRIINETVAVPFENKNLVQVLSDDHGSPPLIASHFFPAAPAEGAGEVDAGIDPQQIGGWFGRVMTNLRQQRESTSQAQPNNESADGPDHQPGKADLLDPAKPGSNDHQDLSDKQAEPLVDSGHKGVNALDYYCTWKLFDALEDAAFYGKNRDYALGNTPHQRYMGKWSDGVPVKELVVQVGEAK